MRQRLGTGDAVHDLTWPRQAAAMPTGKQDAIGLALVGHAGLGAVRTGGGYDIANGLALLDLGSGFDVVHQEARALAVTHVHAAHGHGG